LRTEGSGRSHAYFEATAAQAERSKSKHRVVPLSGKIEQYRKNIIMNELIRPICCFAALIFATMALAKQPNIIVVMTDDQGYPELSVNGNPILKTPHLDHLHSESLRLEDYHVSPMCAPTRGQLMTGLDAARNGAINVSSGRGLLRPEVPIIANFFGDAGYATGLFGKWHLGSNYPFRPEDR